MRLRTVLIAVVVLTAACGGHDSGGGGTGNGADVRVVAAFYPLAEAARQVGGADVEVDDLTPAGGEPHDLEVTSNQLDAISGADVVLVMGHGFQPAVEDAAERNDATVAVLDHLPVGAEGRDVASGLDPHVWLDPVLMGRIVGVVADVLRRTDPAHASAYARRAYAYQRELAALDRAYRQGLASCRRTTIFTSHAAFGWLAKRYHLRQRSLAGVSPEEEPTPDALAKLADDARRDGATTIFTEPLVSSDLAKTLAREAGGLQTKTLDPLEALTKDEIAAHDDYVSVMRRNLATLRTALACR